MPDESGRVVPLLRAFMLAYPNGSSERSAKRAAYRLLKDERISERLAELRSEANHMLMRHLKETGIASKAKRLQRKNRHWEALCKLVESRALAAHPIPGLESGLLELRVRQIGGERVDVYVLDKAVLDALNELEESAAKELGHVSESEIPIFEGRVVVLLPSNGRDEIPRESRADGSEIGGQLTRNQFG